MVPSPHSAFFCTQRCPGPLLGSVFLAQELEQDAVRETLELLLRQSFQRRIEDLLRLSEMVGGQRKLTARHDYEALAQIIVECLGKAFILRERERSFVMFTGTVKVTETKSSQASMNILTTCFGPDTMRCWWGPNSAVTGVSESPGEAQTQVSFACQDRNSSHTPLGGSRALLFVSSKWL